MRTVTVDCEGVENEACLWQLYIDVVMPEGASYFGRNFHAFRDALAGGPGWPGDCELRFVNTAAMRCIGGGPLHRALQDAAASSQFIKVYVE